LAVLNFSPCQDRKGALIVNIGRRKFDDYKLELLGFHGVLIETVSDFFPGTIKNHGASVGGQSACEKHGPG
jgi:hypothetical protein